MSAVDPAYELVNNPLKPEQAIEVVRGGLLVLIGYS